MARVLIPLANGCEELEAVTVIDLLRRAGIDVVTAGLTDGPVTASRGVVLIPDRSLDQVLDDDPLQDRRVAARVPDAIRVDHRDRPVLA